MDNQDQLNLLTALLNQKKQEVSALQLALDALNNVIAPNLARVDDLGKQLQSVTGERDSLKADTVTLNQTIDSLTTENIDLTAQVQTLTPVETLVVEKPLTP